MTARDYLASLELFGIKLGLEQMRVLVDRLGHPERAFRAFLVAGTNGKGSVTAMAERALREAGWRTGRYTSPHLVNVEERVAIDGEPIGRDVCEAMIGRVRDAAAALPSPPTYFEATTALAFEAFRSAGVEVAVVEVGLGGRLDATNVLSPEGVAITAIDFDHEQHLGGTLVAIAGEKAGIIKPGRFCVLGRNPDEVRAVVLERCRALESPFVYAPDEVQVESAMVAGVTTLRLHTPAADYGELTLGLRGRHQIDNAIAAARLLEAADSAGVRVPARAIRAGLERVVWPARLELRRWRGADVLIDGAHNPAGAAALASYVGEAYGRRLPFVIGVMEDKNVAGIVGALAPSASRFVCTAAASARAASSSALAAMARQAAPEVPVVDAGRPIDALTEALARDTLAVVAGSLYLAGEIRAELS